MIVQRILTLVRVLAVLVALLVSSLPAAAQVTRSGETIVAFPKSPAARFPDVAFDSLHDVYLVVSGQQPIEGRFVGANGQPLGTKFKISPSNGVIASRVDFNPVAGTFVVTWVDEASSAPADDAIGAIVLKWNGSGPEFVSGEVFVGNNGVAKHTESAPSLACSTNSSECLITWAQWAAPWDVHGQRIDAGNGALVGGPIPIGTGGAWDGLPSVAYNSQQREYFVVHTSEIGVVMYTVGQRIQEGTGAHLGKQTLYNNGANALNNYPEVAYNTRGNVYMVITWFITANGADVYGRLADGNGNPLGNIIPVAANPFFEGGDGIGIAYNPVHDGFFAVFQGPSSDTLGIGMNGLGAPTQPVFRAMVSGAARDIYQPQIAGSTLGNHYLIATSVDFNRVSTQLLDTPINGTPGPGPGPDPTPTPTPVTINLENAPNGSWFFAEGTAGSGSLSFNTFYLISNEHNEPLTVRAYFSGEAGQTKELTFNVPALSRTTLNLAEAAGQGSYGAVFQSLTLDKDIFVERSVYWGNNFEGSSSEIGVKGLAHNWYFAEGSCGCNFYSNFFLLFNPTQNVATVNAVYALDDGQAITRQYTIGPQSRLTIFANDVPGLGGHNFGTSFHSTEAVVAERAIYWGPGWTGGTASIGAKGPSTQWLFAEGAASPGFDTFYLVLNPNSEPTDLVVTFSLSDGSKTQRSYTVGAGSRMNVWLNETLGQIGAASAVFNSGQPVIVERSIYWGWQDGAGWIEGTNSIGVTGGHNVWHVPEGSTTASFEDFLLVYNPNDAEVALNITMYTEQQPGSPQTVATTVPAGGRATFYMAALLQQAGFPAQATFATRVATTDGRPIVVEHAQYWQRTGSSYWRGGSSAFGIPR